MAKKIETELTGKELGDHNDTKALRKIAMAYAEKFLIGRTITNEHSLHKIKLTRQGVKHSLAAANSIELKLLPALEDLLREARYTGCEHDKKMRPHIKAIHKYISSVRMKEELLIVGIVTRETTNGHEHYDHFVVSEKE